MAETESNWGKMKGKFKFGIQWKVLLTAVAVAACRNCACFSHEP